MLRRIQETLGRIAQGRQTLEEDKMRPDTVAERNAKLAMVTTIAGLEVLSDDRGELTEEGLKRWRELRESQIGRAHV